MSSRGDLAGIAFGGLLFFLVSPASAQAQDPSPPAPPARTTEAAPSEGAETVSFTAVTIRIVAGDASLEELNTVLIELLGTAGLAVNLERHAEFSKESLDAEAPDGHLRLWIQLQPERARLYFADPKTARYLKRDVPLPSGLNELGREAIAQVVHSSVVALRDGDPGLSRAEMSDAIRADAEAATHGSTAASGVTGPPAPPRRSAQAPPDNSVAPRPLAPVEPDYTEDVPDFLRRSSLHDEPWPLEGSLAAYYDMTHTGGEGVAHGPGALFSLGFQFDSWRFGIAAQGAYQFPHSGRTRLLEVQARSLLLSGGLLAGYWPRSGYTLTTLVAVGTEAVTFSPRALQSHVVTQEETSEFRPMANLQVWFGYWFSRVQVAAGAQLAMPFVDTHYDLQRSGSAQRELEVAALHPSLRLGVWYR
ncbi:MAG: hypothetical protein RJA70_1221 [Pseudomonadota bacterium]|jgi:hypothetical protein